MGEFKPPVPGISGVEEPVKSGHPLEQEKLAELKVNVVRLLSVIRTGMEVVDADDLLRDLNEEQSAEVRLSPEVQEVAKNAIIQSLQDSRAETVKIIIRDFNVPKEILHSPELASVAREGALKMLRHGSLSGMRSIAEKFDIPSDFFRTPEAIESAKMGIEKLSRLEKVRQDLIDGIEMEFGL